MAVIFSIALVLEGRQDYILAAAVRSSENKNN